MIHHISGNAGSFAGNRNRRFEAFTHIVLKRTSRNKLFSLFI
jgi:hypothetical protein